MNSIIFLPDYLVNISTPELLAKAVDLQLVSNPLCTMFSCSRALYERLLKDYTRGYLGEHGPVIKIPNWVLYIRSIWPFVVYWPEWGKRFEKLIDPGVRISETLISQIDSEYLAQGKLIVRGRYFPLMIVDPLL